MSGLDPAREFDLPTYQREKIRRLEQKVDGLTQLRDRLERILAITLKAAAGTDCHPLTLLAVIEEIDRQANKPGASIDELAQLLRETDPGQFVRKAA